MTTLSASRRPFRLLTIASTLWFAATTTAVTEDAHLCGISSAWANSDGQYIFNNNAWGDDGSGAECTNVFGDGTSFETIWGWSGNATQTHSFPNVQLNTALFPLQLSSLAAMNLQASWTVAPTDGITENVVYDMFVDTDKGTSNSTTNAKYEIMIWIGAFGQPWPLGAGKNPFTGVLNTSLPMVNIASTTFSLYSGANDGGQIVHSWVALTNQADFTADVTPLITYLTNNSLVPSDAYMGILQFGSETWHSPSNVTFDVSSFNLNVTSTSAAANAKASEAVNPSSTGSSTSASSSASTSTGSSSSSKATPSSPGSSSSSGSSSSTGTSSSPSSSSTGSSGSSIISLPFWFWEIAAAGCLFAML